MTSKTVVVRSEAPLTLRLPTGSRDPGFPNLRSAFRTRPIWVNRRITVPTSFSGTTAIAAVSPSLRRFESTCHPKATTYLEARKSCESALRKRLMEGERGARSGPGVQSLRVSSRGRLALRRARGLRLSVSRDVFQRFLVTSVGSLGRSRPMRSGLAHCQDRPPRRKGLNQRL
jgi:hypothetical protein